jgi:hypothetical protein
MVPGECIASVIDNELSSPLFKVVKMILKQFLGKSRLSEAMGRGIHFA